MFIGGVSESGKYFVGYVYLVEMMPKKAQDLSGLILFLTLGIVTTYHGIQFYFITSDAHVNNWIGLILASISMLLTLIWLPESPRFLHSHKRFDEARKVMERISRINGVQI